jgi:hypothetical protein
MVYYLYYRGKLIDASFDWFALHLKAHSNKWPENSWSIK